MSATGWALLAWALATIVSAIWYSHLLSATERPTPPRRLRARGYRHRTRRSSRR